jgi:UrcA family protein
MNSQNTRLLATLVAVTALLGASAASAARGWQPKQPTIGIRGLDPATPAGACNLYRQIVAAANRVCGSAMDGASIAANKDRNGVERCTKQAISAAVQSVDAAFGLDLEQLAGGSHTLQPLHRPLSGESFGLPSSSRSGDLPKAVATSRRRAVLRA